MSILIKGMKLPKNCGECPLNREEYWNGDTYMYFCHPRKAGLYLRELDTRHPDCPLIELTPHGRLIDADAFAENLKNVSIRQGYKDTLIGEYLSVDDVIDAIIADLTGKALCGFELNPTIIPADKGETE